MEFQGNSIPAQFVRECFIATPGGTLYWRARPRHHFQTERGFELFSESVGLVATRPDRAGYLITAVTYNGKRYTLRGHRIVWLLTTGEWPAGEIDHISRVKFDNRFANLRDVSRIENARNRRLGASGVRGVYPLPSGRYRAKAEHQHVGCFDTVAQATSALTGASQ